MDILDEQEDQIREINDKIESIEQDRSQLKSEIELMLQTL